MPNIENEEKQEKVVEKLESISQNTEETLEIQKQSLENDKEVAEEEKKEREEEKQERDEEKRKEDVEKEVEKTNTSSTDSEKEDKKKPSLTDRFKHAVDRIKTTLGYAGRAAGFLLSENAGSGGFSQMAKDSFSLLNKGADTLKDLFTKKEDEKKLPDGFQPVSFKDQLKAFFTDRSKNKEEKKTETIENKTIENIQETNKELLNGASVDNSKSFKELRSDVQGSNSLLRSVFGKLSDILSLNKEWRIDDEVANRRKAIQSKKPDNAEKNDKKDDSKDNTSKLAQALFGGIGALGAGIAAKLAKNLLKGSKGAAKGLGRAVRALAKTKYGKAAGLALGAGLLKKAIPSLAKEGAEAGAKTAAKNASKGGLFSKAKNLFGIKPEDAKVPVKTGETAKTGMKEVPKAEAKPKIDAEKAKFNEIPKGKTPKIPRSLAKKALGGVFGAGLSALAIAEGVQAADNDNTLTQEQKEKAKGDAVLLEAGSVLGGILGGAGGSVAGSLVGPAGTVVGGMAGSVAGGMAGEHAAQKFVEAFPEASRQVGKGVQWAQDTYKEYKENAEYDKKMEEGKIFVRNDMSNMYDPQAVYLGDLSKKEQEEFLKAHPEAVHKIMNNDFARMQAGSAAEIAKKLYVEPEPYKIEAKPIDDKSKIADNLAKSTVEEKKKEDTENRNKLAEKITEGQIKISANKPPIIMDDHRVTINNNGGGGNSTPFPIIMPTRDPAGFNTNGGY